VNQSVGTYDARNPIFDFVHDEEGAAVVTPTTYVRKRVVNRAGLFVRVITSRFVSICCCGEDTSTILRINV
jgi:hypothetical protein